MKTTAMKLKPRKINDAYLHMCHLSWLEKRDLFQFTPDEIDDDDDIKRDIQAIRQLLDQDEDDHELNAC